jgi:colicin import membrane protein
MPVDIISADQLSKITAGIKTGEKDKPKPLVEKIADARPVEDAVGKITEKKEIVTASAPEPPQAGGKTGREKARSAKTGCRGQAQGRTETDREEAGSAEGRSDRGGLKSEDTKKPVPKPEAKAAPPQPPKPKQERTFDQSKIAALLDKRDPTRQSITGAALNSSASLGATRGTAATLSQSELDAMRARLASLWNVQPGVEHPEELYVTVRIRLNPDRRLAAPPQVVSSGSSARYQAAAEAAVRAVLQGQPYTMLRDETYEQWKYMDIDFDPKQMFRS